MNAYQLQNFNGGQLLSSIDVEKRDVALRGISQVAAQAQSLGIADWELMSAIGKDRGDFDPLGIHCRFYGTLMRFLGSGVTCFLSIIAFVCLISWVADKIEDIWSWLKETIGSWAPWFAFGGTLLGAGIAVGNYLSRDEDAAEDARKKITGIALREMAFGLLPAPLAGVSRALVGYIRTVVDSGSSSSASHAPSGGGYSGFGFPPASYASFTAPTAVNTTYPTVPANTRVAVGAPRGSSTTEAIREGINLGARIAEIIAGRRTSDGVSDEEIQAYADATGCTPDAIYDRLTK